MCDSWLSTKKMLCYNLQVLLWSIGWFSLTVGSREMMISNEETSENFILLRSEFPQWSMSNAALYNLSSRHLRSANCFFLNCCSCSHGRVTHWEERSICPFPNTWAHRCSLANVTKDKEMPYLPHRAWHILLLRPQAMLGCRSPYDWGVLINCVCECLIRQTDRWTER